MRLGKIVLMATLLVISVQIMGQDWQWYADISSTGEAQPNVFNVDNNGDLLMFMVYEGSITIGGRTMNSVGDKDMILSKFTPDGDTLWNIPMGSTGRDVPRRMVTNAANETYVTGSFAADCDFSGQVLTNPSGDEDVFLAKYDSDGNLLWVRAVAWGPGNDRSSGIVIDEAGDISMIGFFRTSLYFESDTLTSDGGVDNYYAKYNSNGDFIRAIPYLGNNNTTRLNEIARGGDNSLLISGFYVGSLSCQTESLTSSGDADILLINVDTAGAETWIRTAGGLGNDRGTNSSTDQYGNIYLAGYIGAEAAFDSTDYGLRESSSIAATNDMFLAKYNKNGILQWKTSNGSTGVEEGRGVKVYDNIIQFTGSFQDNIIFGSDTLDSKGGSVDAGFFIYNTQGDPVKGVSIEGSLEDEGADVIYDNAGNSYLAGMFSSDTLYMGSLELVKDEVGVKSPFLAKYQIPFSSTFSEVKHLDCNNDNSGELIITPYYGQYPFTYTWSHNGTLNDSVASGLSAGTYSVTVTDFNSRQSIKSITLNEPDPLVIMESILPAACHPNNGVSDTGAVDITVTGGTIAGSYSYAWEALSGSGVNVSAEDQTTLTAGEYRVTVTDDNLCTATETYTVTQPDPITFGGSVVTDASDGASDGAIDLTPLGGNDTPPYTSYQWSAPGSQITEDITGLAAANYSVTITDALGCVGDTSFLVADNTTFIASIVSKTDVDCKNEATGSVTVTTSGGDGPYDYEWRKGVDVVGINSPTLLGADAGIYTVLVTDNSDGDDFTVQVEILEPDLELTAVNISATDLTCQGNNSGLVDFTPSGGTLPYTFAWSAGGGFSATTEDIVDLAASEYFVTVTDANDCVASNSAVVDEPDAMGLSIVETQEIACFGELAGVLTANVIGRPETDLSYLWNDPGNQVTKAATELEAGTYEVTVTDLSGCNVSLGYTLTQNAELVASANTNEPDCFGNDNGTISLDVSGGEPGARLYAWSTGDFTSIPLLQDLSAGAYSVTVSDGNGCETIVDISLTQPTQLSIASSIADTSCYGVDNGQLSVQGQGGTPPYEYSVDGGVTFQEADSVFTNLAADIYTLMIRDDNDCQSTTTEARIEEVVRIQLTDALVTNVSCLGATDGAITISASGGDESYEYSFDNGANYQNGASSNGLSAGNYQLLVRDGSGCTSLGKDTVVSQPSTPSVTFTDTTLTHITTGSNGAIQVTAGGGTEPYAYTLSPDGLNTTDGNFQNLTPGIYEVAVTDDLGCESATITLTLVEASGENLVIYSAFSPNNDGVNDTWIIENIGQYAGHTVSVLNTWGNKVFSSTDYEAAPWDGTKNGNELPSGTYYYIIDLGDGSDAMTGPVSIVR